MTDQEKLEHKDYNTYIYKHMCVQYLKGVFASSDMILTVVVYERTYLPFKKQL